MKLFLSWSGEKSHAAAKVFHEWLPDVVQQLQPWISSESIDKGATWLTSIRDALQSTNGVGIFFLTAEAMASEWLMYEAGGVAAVDASRVCTVCVGIEPRDIVSPLSFFQSTRMEHRDVLQLVKTLNGRCVAPLDNARLEKSFAKAWPELEARIATVLEMKEAVAPVKSTNDPVTNALDRVLDGQRRIEARIGALEQRQAVAIDIEDSNRRAFLAEMFEKGSGYNAFRDSTPATGLRRGGDGDISSAVRKLRQQAAAQIASEKIDAINGLRGSPKASE
ncbi:hypothetical protein [Rhizobacter fulvus]